MTSCLPKHKHHQDIKPDSDGIFSDIYNSFDSEFIDNLIELGDLSMSYEADDVIFCDRMMTEAAIKLPKVEPRSPVHSINETSLFYDSCYTSTSHDQSLSIDNVDPHINEYDDYSYAGQSIQYLSSRLAPNFNVSDDNSRDTICLRQASKRQRQDSTDAMDHAPMFSLEATAVSPYGHSVRTLDKSLSENKGCSRLVQSIIRCNMLSALNETEDVRHSGQYVLRQSTGVVSTYLSNMTKNNQLDSDRQILPRNRYINNPRNAKNDHSNGSGKYVLYPPTPPSSTHCSSDSDDSSNCMTASSSFSFGFRSQHHFQSSSISALSGELILTEEERRTFIAEGFPIPCKLPLTKQEERVMKKVRRKIKNKISAQESRRKKKEYLEMLEKKIDQYSRDYGEMKRRCESLESTNKSLVSQLRNLQSVFSGKSSSTSTGTCLMVLVFCFTLLIGGGNQVGVDVLAHDIESSIVSLRIVSRPRSGFPALWFSQWCPRLGYFRMKHSISPHSYRDYYVSTRAGELLEKVKSTSRPSLESLSDSVPPSRILLGLEDEAFVPYGTRAAAVGVWNDPVVACDPCRVSMVVIGATQHPKLHLQASTVNVTF